MMLEIIEPGVMEYEEALALQRLRQARRIREEIPDTLILLEHPPVITLGRRAVEEDVLLAPGVASGMGIRVVRIERGGEVTYHGPGQLVGYLICGLAVTGKSVKRFVHQVEDCLIQSLVEGWGIRAGRREEYIGVWVGEEKIAAIGLSISRGVTMHGFALNVNTNLDHFAWIVPCGIRTKGVTSIKKITGGEVPMDGVKTLVARKLKEVFGYE
ncbi:MAG: lipoyl(octanoyl) transferase LipB [Spirochaetales bacterium]|jgi:lipoyl(octanoyl) transferase|nr:lipoyl(octanoyl) transferase LipB [Spirochaetales bacterium]